MGLFKRDIREEYEKELRAVQRCKNQKKLARFALGTKRIAVWQEAVDRITDEQMLCQLAKNTDNESLAVRAAERLTSPALLTQTALSGTPFHNVKIAALRKLDDQSLIERIARTDDSIFVRQAALEKLTDKSLQTQIAVSDPSFHIREWAAKHVKDQDALIYLAKTDEASVVRNAAVARIRDQRTRAELALWDRGVDFKERLRALEILNPDDATLVKLTTKKERVQLYDHFQFYEAAVQRMNDPDALVYAAQALSEGHREIADLAAARIHDQAHLVTLLEGEYTAEAALDRLGRLGMLDDTALRHVHPSLSEEAVAFARDKAAFRQKLRSMENGSDVAEAYDDQNVEKLMEIATPESAEALVLLLRGERGKYDFGGPTALALRVSGAIYAMWRTGGTGLRDPLRQANNWPIHYHRDNGADDIDCHLDAGPIVFDL